jgi:calcineurin-like phosphoesterase family protein
MIWFTADHHFGHGNIITHCARPYRSAIEMDFDLVRRWNDVVMPGDTVWHLGDFAWRGCVDLPDIFAALHGRKHLIRGNHDRRDVLALPWSEPPRASWMIEIDGVRIYMSHHPRQPPPGAFGLYGHMHGRQPDEPISRAFDVGVDVWDYAPIGWPEARAVLGA